MAGSTWIDSTNAAYPAMARLYDAHQASEAAADQGYYVCAGADVVASGTAGKLKVNTGTIFSATTEVNIVTALDNITCATLADASNPRWGILEIDNTTTPGTPTATLNLGTAAASPLMPTLTAGRSAHAWIYLPANANNVVDALTGNANGNVKIIDARQLRTVHIGRQIAYDPAIGAFTPDTSLATILGTIPTIPANSLSVGDSFQIVVSGFYTNNTNATTMRIQVLLGTSTLFDYTAGAATALTTSASSRKWTLTLSVLTRVIGASGNFLMNGQFIMGPPDASTTLASQINGWGEGANGSFGVYNNTASAAVDTTADQTLDVKTIIGAAGGTINKRTFSVIKYPVQ